MIRLSRLNGVEFYLNAELIQMVEMTPDTVITLTCHEKMVVKEPAEVVIGRLLEYQRLVRQQPEYTPNANIEAGG